MVCQAVEHNCPCRSRNLRELRRGATLNIRAYIHATQKTFFIVLDFIFSFHLDRSSEHCCERRNQNYLLLIANWSPGIVIVKI